MRSKPKKPNEFVAPEKLAHDFSHDKPLSPAMRQKWEAALRTGRKLRSASAKRQPKVSRIVPISIEPKLLAAIDKFAKSHGMTRSRLVAEGLQLRMKAEKII